MTESLRVHTTTVEVLPAVIEKIRSLSSSYVDAEIAERLNSDGYRTARSRRFTEGIVRDLRQDHGIRKNHTGEPDYYTAPKLAAILGVSDTTVVKWCEERKLVAERQGENCTYWIKLAPDELSKLRDSIKQNRHIRH